MSQDTQLMLYALQQQVRGAQSRKLGTALALADPRTLRSSGPRR